MPSYLTLLLWVAAFGVIIYLFFIRPNKKRQDEQTKMMNAMQPGTRVMLTSGIFGTIEAVGDKQMVIELAPGTAITVVKQAIAKVLTEADEEFEYTDDNAIEPSDGVRELTAAPDDVAESPEYTPESSTGTVSAEDDDDVPNSQESAEKATE